MPSLRCLPGGGNEHPAGGPPTSPMTPTPTLWAAAAPLTLMMLLRRGVARAASRRPASLSPGTPAAPGSATPLRRSLIRPPEAAAGAASPAAASAAARGSSSPAAASRGTGPSLAAAPSAMANQARSGGDLRARQHDWPRVSGSWHRCAQARGGSPAGLCFSARRRLQRRPQLYGEETSLGQRRPRAVVQEVKRAGAGWRRGGGVGGAGRRCEREGEAGEKPREGPET